MPTIVHRRPGRLVLFLAAVLAACGGGGDNPITPSSIGLSLAQGTLNVAQSASGTVAVSTPRSNFAGDISLSASGVPAGVTVSFSPSTLTGSTAQSTMTIAAASAAVPGTSTITVTAAGSGVTTQTSTIALTVPQPPAYTLALSSSAVSVAAGTSTTVNAILARTNFTGGVTFSVSGLPSGATANFSPSPTTGDASVLTIITGGAAPGIYSLTVTTSAAGLTDRTAALTLTIGTYTLGLASTSATLAQGASTTVDVTLTRTNFAASVNFSASGVPPGGSVTFVPSETTGNASVMTVSAGIALPGVYTMTVTAGAAGTTNRMATFTVTITGSTPSYTLTPASPTVAVNAGATGTVVLNVNRTNFTGDVNLSVSGLPTGATASFSPNPATGTTSTLTIVTNSAAAGNYTLTITGAASGMTNRTATVTLTINAGGSSTNVSFAFCADGLPTWVGYQSGAGAWQQASVGAGNTYSFAITNRGAVAIVSPVDGSASQYGYQTLVFYASASELQSIGATYCGTPGPVGTKQVNGSVSSTGGNSATIVLGRSQAGTTGDGIFQLTGVQNGPRDLLATLNSSTTSSTTRMVIRRNQDPVNGATLAPIDFTGSESFAPLSSILSLAGIASGTPVYVGSFFTTANGSGIPLGFQEMTAGTASYLGVPAPAAGDLHELAIFVEESTGLRGSFSYFTNAGNRTLTFGGPLNAVSVTSLGSTPYPRLRAQFARQSEYGSLAYVSFTQQGFSSAPTDRIVDVIMTPAYLGSVAFTWDLSIPDMSGAAGFSSGWMLGAGRSTDVATAAYGGDILLTTPTNGTVFQFAQRAGTTTTSAFAGPTALRLAPAAPSRTEIQAQSVRVLRIAHNRRLLRRR